MNTLTALLNYEQSVQEGDVFRQWIVSLSDGSEALRFQRLTRGNPCRLTAEMIRHDYANIGQYGESWNNMCQMPKRAIRVRGGKAIEISLDEALASLAARMEADDSGLGRIGTD